MSKNELRSSEKRRRRGFANGAGSIPKTQSFLFIPKYSKIN